MNSSPTSFTRYNALCRCNWAERIVSSDFDLQRVQHCLLFLGWDRPEFTNDSVSRSVTWLSSCPAVHMSGNCYYTVITLTTHANWLADRWTNGRMSGRHLDRTAPAYRSRYSHRNWIQRIRSTVAHLVSNGCIYTQYIYMHNISIKCTFNIAYTLYANRWSIYIR